MAVGQQSVLSLQSARPVSSRTQQRLSEADAVDLWIARWLRVRRRDLLIRYGCDPRRIYEIWEGQKFPAARDKALVLFRERHPELEDRIDFGPHRRIPRRSDDARQLVLFETA